MHIRFIAASVLFSSISATHAEEVDITAGKALTDENCTACHGTEFYTRKDRKVTSRPKLTSQVRRCELQLDLSWFDEDIENTAAYLNKEFYHFK